MGIGKNLGENSHYYRPAGDLLLAKLNRSALAVTPTLNDLDEISLPGWFELARKAMNRVLNVPSPFSK
jgi:hypothetical protein